MKFQEMGLIMTPDYREALYSYLHGKQPEDEYDLSQFPWIPPHMTEPLILLFNNAWRIHVLSNLKTLFIWNVDEMILDHRKNSKSEEFTACNKDIFKTIGLLRSTSTIKSLIDTLVNTGALQRFKLVVKYSSPNKQVLETYGDLDVDYMCGSAEIRFGFDVAPIYEQSKFKILR